MQSSGNVNLTGPERKCKTLVRSRSLPIRRVDSDSCSSVLSTLTGDASVSSKIAINNLRCVWLCRIDGVHCTTLKKRGPPDSAAIRRDRVRCASVTSTPPFVRLTGYFEERRCALPGRFTIAGYILRRDSCRFPNSLWCLSQLLHGTPFFTDDRIGRLWMSGDDFEVINLMQRFKEVCRTVRSTVVDVMKDFGWLLAQSC